MNSNSPKFDNDDLIKSVLLASSIQMTCINCAEIEYVFPIDSESIDDLDPNSYICTDCL